MRVVFTGCAAPAEERAVLTLFPSATCVPGKLCARGPAAFVSYDPRHVEDYAAWFKGLDVRVAAALRNKPLAPGDATYLPVTFDSWAIVCEGVEGLGAALEAARMLQVGTVVCPAFGEASVEAVGASLARRYKRSHDRVHRLKDA